MKKRNLSNFWLFYMFSWLLGPYFFYLLGFLFIYFLLDRFYLGFLTGFFDPIRVRMDLRDLKNGYESNPSDAYLAQKIGEKYVQLGKYQKAIDFLEKAKEKDGESANLILNLGISYFNLGERDQSVENLEKSVQKNQEIGFGIPYVYLAEIYLERGDKQRLERVLKNLEKYSNSENLYKMGKVYKKFGDREKALEMFNLAIKDYKYYPSHLKKTHRKWILKSVLGRVFL